MTVVQTLGGKIKKHYVVFVKQLKWVRKHLLKCQYSVKNNSIVINSPEYEYIFEDDIEKKIIITE